MSASISLVGSLLEAVSEVGTDPALLMAQVQRRETRRSAGLRFQHAWLEERALELTGDAALGLRLGERGDGQGFGIVGQLAANTRTLRDCIDVALTYYPLILDGQRPELTFEQGKAILRYPGTFGTSRSLKLWTEFGMARFAQFGRRFVGRETTVETWFAYARPTYGDDYVRVFGNSIRFDMPHNAFVFPEVLLDLAQPDFDPALYELLKVESNRAMERLSTAQVRLRVRSVLSSLRLGERAEMATAANALGMSERALRRRLATENVCFRELVDEVQRNRALVLAKDPRRSAEAISSALGFSEVSAFHRAFKRWTALTPLQYRMAHSPAGLLSAKSSDGLSVRA